MWVMMAVNVISKACETCPRFQVVVLRDYHGEKIQEAELECNHYDDCLNTLDMYQRGQAENKT